MDNGKARRARALAAIESLAELVEAVAGHLRTRIEQFQSDKIRDPDEAEVLALETIIESKREVLRNWLNGVA